MKHITRAVALLCTLLWIAFIFSNSLDSGAESSAKSSTVHEVVNQVASSLGATEEIPEKAIRTSAHFTEFAALAVLLSLDLALFFSLPPRRALSRRHFWLFLSLPIALAIAAIDEIIQSFSPGRACQFLDVLVDGAGALCGALFFACFFVFLPAAIRAIRARRTNTDTPAT